MMYFNMRKSDAIKYIRHTTCKLLYLNVYVVLKKSLVKFLMYNSNTIFV
jgi:hypothetical protein